MVILGNELIVTWLAFGAPAEKDAKPITKSSYDMLMHLTADRRGFCE